MKINTSFAQDPSLKMQGSVYDDFLLAPAAAQGGAWISWRMVFFRSTRRPAPGYSASVPFSFLIFNGLITTGAVRRRPKGAAQGGRAEAPRQDQGPAPAAPGPPGAAPRSRQEAAAAIPLRRCAILLSLQTISQSFCGVFDAPRQISEDHPPPPPHPLGSPHRRNRLANRLEVENRPSTRAPHGVARARRTGGRDESHVAKTASSKSSGQSRLHRPRRMAWRCLGAGPRAALLPGPRHGRPGGIL